MIGFATLLFEGLLLLVGTVLYNGLFYGWMMTGEYRFAVHEDLMSTGVDEYSDFMIEVGFGFVLGIIVLAIVRRVSGLQLLSFCAAAFSALYFGTPNARLFGNTWSPWEENLLFFGSGELFISIALAMSAVYAAFLWLLR
ncbi:hypothetical protein BTE77_35570 [Ensifer adhaerens]|nr:hypothetical protein BTE77_35570 [Ensifer adhaerens]